MPYLVHGSMLYCLDSVYYNIETGFCYGKASTHIDSKKLYFFRR